jgi:hypothetical protein
MKKIKKTLIGWTETNWKRQFHYNNITKNDIKRKSDWIKRLGGNQILYPKIFRNFRDGVSTIELLRNKTKRVKVKITIEEL